MLKNYSSARSVQIILALMKENGIKKIILSPGSSNIPLAASVQQDPFFELYSAPDERSAAYMACGLAAESQEVVALSCTGATAGRNYLPGLTEAFYRQLPILVITSMVDSLTGVLMPQVVNRNSSPKDAVKLSVEIGVISTPEEEKACVLKTNQAIQELFHHGAGPVHINLRSTYMCDTFSTTQLPHVRKVTRFSYHSALPDLPKGKIAIFVGAHQRWSDDLTHAVERFCDKYNAVVFCDHTSNYPGKNQVLFSLACSQINSPVSFCPDLLIHIGTISGDYPSYQVAKKAEVWRVAQDGRMSDLFQKLTAVFEMDESFFFAHYAQADLPDQTSGYYESCRQYDAALREKLPELPFSNIWMASQLCHRIPENAVIHFGILNSLRSWNLFPLAQTIECYSNTGGFGIDGCLSTLLGGSLATPDKLHFCFCGDLAFFYDLNSLGNRHVGKNLRILLINNGLGTEFKHYSNPGSLFGRDADAYIAAGGHYGKQSRELVKHYAEDLGFRYLSASDAAEFRQNADEFVAPQADSRSIVFECFTESQAESDALQRIKKLNDNISSRLKTTAKQILGKKGIHCIRQILQKN